MTAFDSGADLPVASRLTAFYQSLLEPLTITSPSPDPDVVPFVQTLGELPWEPTADAIEAMGVVVLGTPPALRILLEGARFLPEAAKQGRWEWTISVIAISSIPGDYVHGRLNSDTSPGIRDMLELCMERLSNQTPPVPGGSSIRLVSYEHVLSSPSWTAWKLVTQVEATVIVRRGRPQPPISSLELEVTHGHDRLPGTVVHRR